MVRLYFVLAVLVCSPPIWAAQIVAPLVPSGPGLGSFTSDAGPFPDGIGGYFWIITLNYAASDSISLDVSTTDSGPAMTVYHFNTNFLNETGDVWSGLKFELLAAGDDVALALNNPFISTGGIPGTQLDDDTFQFSSIEIAGSSVVSFDLEFGGPTPPETFQLRVTPIPVPEPATLGAWAVVSGLMLLRRHRRV